MQELKYIIVLPAADTATVWSESAMRTMKAVRKAGSKDLKVLVDRQEKWKSGSVIASGSSMFLPEGVEKLKMAGSPIDPTKIFAAYGSGGPSDRYYLTQPETLKVVRTGKRRAGLGSSVKVVEDWLDAQNNGEGTRKA
ncbi:hypothetical protein LTR09_011742 [Extremus antarcticus]|uniref:Uncharacterized protein n=1 Tax=Extremus antarcticus TaxID=702011 RepID=A0AAJ0DBE5_9PEZI|nr:hypothetical protein LTR09_011742 [Extremus antarcticus]